MNKVAFHILLFLIGICLLTSCGNKKYLAEGDFLYNGSTFKNTKNTNKLLESQKGLTADLSTIFYPEPNERLFGMARTKLWFYNVTKEPKKEKGFRNFLKYKVGQPPVLMRETNPDRISNLITNRLYNSGYFTADVSYNLDLGNKEGRVVYIIDVEPAYKIDSVFFPPDSTELLKRINSGIKKSSLKRGNFYNLKTLKEERQRISDDLRDRGYYYFEPDFILFEVDSTISNKKLNIYVELKPNINPSLLEVYHLDKIYVYPNYDLRNSADATANDSVFLKEYIYLQKDSAFRPEIIADNIYIKDGEVFSREHHDYTVNRLLGLNSFQFVNIKYDPSENKKNGLVASVQLTPYVRKSIRMELSVKSKSNGFTGPGFEASFKNRNAFRGGELFKINLTTGYETQVGLNSTGLNSFELGLNTELDFPRFLLPFNFSTKLNRYTPHTFIKAGAKMLNRVNFFRMNSLENSFGYKWQESNTKFHELSIVNINYTKLANTEAAFDSILNSNPVIRSSFEEQFIFGSTYSYTFDQRLNNKRKNNYYFKGSVDLSGNLLQAITASGNNAQFGDSTNIDVLGSRFSQYSRFELNNKYYIKTGKSNQWVNRLIVGVGLPLGNSRSLPYIKQFFIGGGNSIRAFQARTIGPGSYRPEQASIDGTLVNPNLFLDQSGDLKLEYNSEFRFDVYSIFKGAVFLDAGNIWLLNDDELRPGGDFKVEQFYEQLAVGTGFGLRVDPDFFVIRLDLGFPLRKPFLAEGERWVIDRFGKDAVLNIAIGYPF